MAMCAVCMFDGRRQEDLIDLKDGQIDDLRAEVAYLKRFKFFAKDFLLWCDNGARTMHELDRLQDQVRDLLTPT